MSTEAATFPSATPERKAELREALEEVRARVKAAMPSGDLPEPRLVAVSKIKPAEDIMACYECGQRDFGENYAAELAEKAAILPQDIRWHFIGGLQTNKCKPLASIPNVYAIQTVDSAKKATTLNRSLPESRTTPLNIYVQVNTSQEDQKSGLSGSDEVIGLAKTIVKECPRLRLIGLMTIGSFESSHTEDEENPDFASLVRTREIVEQALKDEAAELGGEWGNDGRLELSMGMSADFEKAIRAGSGSVRVGTSIFGTRPAKQVK